MYRLRTLAIIAIGTATIPAQQYEWRSKTSFASTVSFSSAFDRLRARTVVARGGETWEFDGAVWHRVIAGHPMGPRWQPGYAFDAGRGVVVLFGGSGLGSPVADTWEYDGTSWSQISTPVAPPWRWFGRMVYDSWRQRVLLVGGEGNGGQLGDMWEYDGTSWAQLLPATMPTSRSRQALAFDEQRGITVLFGGINAANVQTDETWEWDGTAWTQRMPATRPPARMNHAMAYDFLRARCVMFGGIDLPTTFTDTWEWDGTDWTQVALGQSAPAEASSHAMSYDILRGETLLLEHYGGGNDTWALDGSGWRIVAPAEAPSTSESHSVAYDPDRGEIVLFGLGTSSATFLRDETWLHRGGHWRRAQPSNRPAARIDTALAFDPTLRGVLLFGGAGQGFANDTWLWTGNNWQQQSPANSPSPRVANAMSSDSARSRVVLFGGQSGTTQFDDTWEWDGANWLQRNPATVPPGRPNHAMTFDPVRNLTVMFGGGNILFGPTLGDHWEWDGTDWTQITGIALPPPRAGAGFVFDDATQTTVLLGGSHTPLAAIVVPRTDVWEWDGAQWSQRAATGLSFFAPWYMRAAHDPELRRTLFFGDSMTTTYWLGLQTTATISGYGSGCPGTFGVPTLRARGQPLLGNLAFELEVSGAIPGNLTVLALGFTGSNAPLPGGCTALLPPVAFVSLLAGMRGNVRYPLPLPNTPALQGTNVHAQAAALDVGGALGGIAALSRGLRVRVDR